MKLTKSLLRFLRRPLGISLIVLVILVVGAAGGKWIAWPAYKEMRENRWIGMAEAAAEQEDFPKAMNFLRKVFAVNPRSIEAWRLAEEITRSQRSPELLFVLRQLMLLDEDDMDLRLEAAELSVVLGKYDEALDILRSLNEEAQNTARFHQVAANLAIVAKQMGTAEHHLQELDRLTDSDESSRLALATLRLQHPDLDVRLGAAETLRSLRDAVDPDVRFRTLRALLMRAMVENDRREGAELLEAFREEHDSLDLPDRILVLHAVLMFAPEEFPDQLIELQAFAQEDPRRIPAVAGFLLKLDKNAEVREWLEALPEETRNIQPILMALTEAVSKLGDAEALVDYLTIQWERDNHHRLASLARALRFLEREREAGDAWQRAIIAATGDSAHLQTLFKLAVAWGWQKEGRDLLGRIFRDNPRENWAYEELVALHVKEKNTSELLQVLSRRLEYQPDDADTSNNFAYLSLLRGVNSRQAHRLAQENYRTDPENPFFVTTHAFSLYRQERVEDALKVIESLEPELLQEQPRNLYYALLLAVNDRIEEAEASLAHVEGANLLPEERVLEERTKAEIREKRGA